ncbi:MAG TPA: PilN domain-containing protein [Stellaceae bacterium]|nr:PilN domain-containing protein [Stellaceae bacterium]
MTVAADDEPKAAGVRPVVERALRWWLGELRGLYGDVVRRLDGGRNAVVVEVGERYWMVRRRRTVLGQIDRATADAAQRRHMLQHLADARMRPGAVVIEIPPERLLAKRIRLPAPAQREIARVVHFEIARHFPFPAERVHFRHRVTGRDGSSIEVEIIAVPREIVAEICDELGGAGLRVGDVVVAGADGTAPLRLPVAASAQAPVLTRGQSWLLALLVVLGAAALASPIVHDRMRLAAIMRESAALRPRVEVLLTARAQQRRAADRVAGPLRLKAARPPLVAVLDRLTRAIPDGSWLVSLGVTGHEVVMSGLSPSAATVALALEHSRDFANVVFRTPILRDPATGLEHFEIAAAIVEAKP